MYDFSFYPGKKVLVTGGLGFIGSNLAIKLVELGSEVTVVDALIPELGGNQFNIDPIKKDVKVVIADMRDSAKMEKVLEGQEVVFNIAGQVSHEDGMVDPLWDLELNATSNIYFLEALRRVNPTAKVIHSGTRQIYGKIEHIPVNERHLVRPSDTNGISKFAGEWYHMVYASVYGLKTTSIRLTNTFGPRQLMRHGRQGFIPFFIRLALDGKEISVYGDGLQVRDMTYVTDANDAMLLAGQSDTSNGKYYNIGGIKPITLLDFTKNIVKMVKGSSYHLIPFPEGRKKIDIGDYVGDYTKIKEDLGWRPKVSIEEGLRRTISYYKKHKKHYW
ncbi:GDP-mannose 4,6-dehydratase [Patescibacteria group bacterium]|nr:GDP-mannose 4,6-dehydratase [Patescibacteria group bacterium]